MLDVFGWMQDSCVQTDGLRQQKRSGGENVTDPCLWAFLLHEWRNKNYFNSCVKFPTTISKVNRCFPQSRQLLWLEIRKFLVGKIAEVCPWTESWNSFITNEAAAETWMGWGRFCCIHVCTGVDSPVLVCAVNNLQLPQATSSMLLHVQLQQRCWLKLMRTFPALSKLSLKTLLGHVVLKRLAEVSQVKPSSISWVSSSWKVLQEDVWT